MGNINNLKGQTFGRLTVLKFGGRNKHGHTIWQCKCECGNIKLIPSGHLLSGRTKSCGCLHTDLLVIRNSRHSLSSTRLYRIWRRMKARCGNSHVIEYKDYGGREINICDEWQNDFMSFYNWAIENGYRDDLTIDRINNDENYEPSNCRWITRYEQGRNQRSNHLITYNNETLCLTDMAIKYNIKPRTLLDRLQRGWSVERALTEPIHKRK